MPTGTTTASTSSTAKRHRDELLFRRFGRRDLPQIAQRRPYVPEYPDPRQRGALGSQRHQVRHRIGRGIQRHQNHQQQSIRHLPFSHYDPGRRRRQGRQHLRRFALCDPYRQRDLPADRRPLEQRQAALDEQHYDPERIRRSSGRQARQRLRLRGSAAPYAAQHFALRHRRPLRPRHHERNAPQYQDHLSGRRKSVLRLPRPDSRRAGQHSRSEEKLSRILAVPRTAGLGLLHPPREEHHDGQRAADRTETRLPPGDRARRRTRDQIRQRDLHGTGRGKEAAALPVPVDRSDRQPGIRHPESP